MELQVSVVAVILQYLAGGSPGEPIHELGEKEEVSSVHLGDRKEMRRGEGLCWRMKRIVDFQQRYQKSLDDVGVL